MTNKEKFKEIFGCEANTNECPIYCDSNNGSRCPYYNTFNTCIAGYWWDAEYKDPTIENQ